MKTIFVFCFAENPESFHMTFAEALAKGWMFEEPVSADDEDDFCEFSIVMWEQGTDFYDAPRYDFEYRI